MLLSLCVATVILATTATEARPSQVEANYRNLVLAKLRAQHRHRGDTARSRRDFGTRIFPAPQQQQPQYSGSGYVSVPTAAVPAEVPVEVPAELQELAGPAAVPVAAAVPAQAAAVPEDHGVFHLPEVPNALIEELTDPDNLEQYAVPVGVGAGVAPIVSAGITAAAALPGLPAALSALAGPLAVPAGVVAGAAVGVAAASAPVPGERAETGQQQQHYAPQAEDTAAAQQLSTVLDSIVREMSILCSAQNITAVFSLFLK